MLTLADLKKKLKLKGDSKRAKNLQRFFKTGKGEYGEGDIFIGLTVPEIREMAKKYSGLAPRNFSEGGLGFLDIKKLLRSKIHEERLIALLILVNNFQKGRERERQKIYRFYLKNTKHINNWDLVDLSAHKIVGAYLMDKPRNILYKLAKSKNLWERRIAIIATFQFINNNQFKESLKISEILLSDKHDLIHKAAGWALREIGKRSLKDEEKFLKKHYGKMPRTMLRYAIERFSENKRQMYLKKI
jgi:3-methyladenine DNA glycosylase AlkD